MNRLLVPAALLALLVGGCGSGDAPVSEQERQVGAEAHPQLLAQFGGSYNGEEREYLEQLGAGIASAAGLSDQCTFTLINNDVVNAFAVPGCYIYVTRGLMAIVNSEAELASVLAHELGHIAANHSERQQRRSLIRGLGVAAINAVAGSGRLANVAGATAALFGLRYSRTHEYEADDLGVRYLRKAGYDPYAAADMLAALGRHQQFLTATRGHEASTMPEWALTHPLTENRLSRARAAAEASGVSPDVLAEKRPEYLLELDGLLYGDDPEQGFVTGRRFAHPTMRIAFEAPPGFTLANTPQAILIDGPDGLRGMFSGGQMPANGLVAYAEATLANLLGEAPVEIAPAASTMIGGVRALVVPGIVRTQEGPVSFSLAAYEGAGGEAFHFIMISKPGAAPAAPAIGALYRSFRLLGPEETATLRPRRIQTVRVGSTDTLRSFVDRMAVEDSARHFLMLNGRTEQQRLRAGEFVKIVVTSSR